MLFFMKVPFSGEFPHDGQKPSEHDLSGRDTQRGIDGMKYDGT
jgi:hypothetical protein